MLKASTGSWKSADGSKNLTYTYAWELCPEDSGCHVVATSPSLTLTPGDGGNQVTVVVTATDLEGQSTSATALPVTDA